jgi:phenylacetate-coenzyme A ligase PaaK-like adenylate-forming protein
MTSTAGSDLEGLRSRVRAELATRVPEHVARLGWSREQLATHQQDRLRALLRHAVEQSEFHARRLAAVDPDRFEVGDLGALPVMSKSDMMASFDQIVTDHRLNRKLVEDQLQAAHTAPSLLLNEYVCLASGGSSGVRGVFVQTVGAYAEFVASLMRRPVADMIAAGGPPPEGLVIALVAAGSAVHSTGLGAATSSGPVRLLAAPATLPLTVLVERLNALQPPTLMGYPTKLAQLAAEQRAARLRIAPRSVVATSELLTDEDRAAITAAFGVPVTNQFASTEGLVGRSEPGGTVLRFATDMCLVELVDEDNQPVAEPTPSSKVLLTNLHNHTQPLIRYELTDRFIPHPALADGHTRAMVDGRADELFHYPGAVIHPLVLRTVLVATPTVTEYQIHQTQTGIHADIVLDSPVLPTALANSLTRNLQHAGLPDPTVTISVVDHIQRHLDTGKARRFIPL